MNNWIPCFIIWKLLETVMEIIKPKWQKAPFPGISEIFLNWEIYITLTPEEQDKIRENGI